MVVVAELDRLQIHRDSEIQFPAVLFLAKMHGSAYANGSINVAFYPQGVVQIFQIIKLAGVHSVHNASFGSGKCKRIDSV